MGIARRDFITGGVVAASAAASAAGFVGAGQGAHAAQADELTVSPGIYEGMASGVGGPVGVLVRVEVDGVVSSITIEQNNETAGFASPAMQGVADAIIAGQSLNVDTVAGATFSSAALIGAVRDALGKAGLAERFDAAPAYAFPAPAAPADLVADVVVVGGGVAGLMCAITAARGGLDVVLLEKMDYLGGTMLRCDSTWLCAGGMRGELRYGGQAWVPYYDYSTPISNREYIRIGDAMNDLLDMGVSFVPYEDDPFAPIYLDCSRLATPRWREGNAQVGARMAAQAYKEGVSIFTGCSVTDLIDEDGTVTGVKACWAGGEEFSVKAPSVVLACGNYTARRELADTWLPDYANVRRSYCEGDTGDHVAWLDRLGAAWHDLGEPSSMVPLEASLRNIPFFTCFYSLVVDKAGRRFACEGDGSYGDYGLVERAAVSADPADPTHYFIMDQALWNMYPAHIEFEDLVAQGLVTKHDSLEDIVEAYGLNELVEEVAHYNEMVAAGEDSDFARVVNFQAFSLEGPYWVAKAVPGMIMDYGGVCINADFAVVNEQGDPVPGLYAIGQTVGATTLMEGLDSLNGGVGPFTASGWMLGYQLADVYVGGTYAAAGEVDGGAFELRVTVEDETRKVLSVELASAGVNDDVCGELEDLAAAVVESQTMPTSSQNQNVCDAFVNAFSVCLQKADTYREFMSA